MEIDWAGTASKISATVVLGVRRKPFSPLVGNREEREHIEWSYVNAEKTTSSFRCWASAVGPLGAVRSWGPSTQTEVDEVVRYAVDHGCNFFDTAELYYDGGSEQSLGSAIKGIPREKLVICTKISPSNTEPRKLAEHCEASLRRLQTDYIDLYLVHWPITAHSIEHFTD